MSQAYLVVEDVASTLVANVEMDLVVGVGPVAWLSVIWVMGTIYKLVQVHLWPHTIVRPGYMMVQLILVKVTMHPVLHIVTMERRECDTRPVMMWAAQAAGKRSSRSRVHVCVECTLSPLVRRAMRGAAAGSMSVAGASIVRKWLVAPESRMAHRLMVATLVGMVLTRIAAARA
jgi:hypothetical protein